MSDTVSENQEPITRPVEGGKEVWDTIFQIWRPMTKLEAISLRKREKDRFLCPDCGEEVEEMVYYTVWETRNVNRKTGDTDGINDEGREDEKWTYRCVECGWEDGPRWHEARMREHEADQNQKD